MFIIQNMYVEDKDLAKVLRALAGLIIKMDPPRPVINAALVPTKGGKVIQQVAKDGTVKEAIYAKVRAFNKGTELPISQIKTMVREAGGSDESYSYYISQMKKDKVVKLKGRGLWIVL